MVEWTPKQQILLSCLCSAKGLQLWCGKCCTKTVPGWQRWIQNKEKFTHKCRSDVDYAGSKFLCEYICREKTGKVHVESSSVSSVWLGPCYGSFSLAAVYAEHVLCETLPSLFLNAASPWGVRPNILSQQNEPHYPSLLTEV